MTAFSTARPLVLEAHKTVEPDLGKPERVGDPEYKTRFPSSCNFKKQLDAVPIIAPRGNTSCPTTVRPLGGIFWESAGRDNNTLADIVPAVPATIKLSSAGI
jgi:hypothetical protein